ncbi:YcnI family protein [Methylibium sp.]|uniref:YcnI family copper-binding membrane protein n=1 Tax=Methylibium sp. TaxID=2067992 RepID=UPI003D133B9F
MPPLSMAAARRLLGVGLAGASALAQAHITLETPEAEAGSHYKAVLRVSHGCDGSAVKALIVKLPPGVQGAKPMPKPGWRIDIERSPLATPYASHGRRITEDVSQVRWSGGPLPDAHYDEFVLTARLPQTPGRLYWQVSQICEQGRIDWAEVPAAGQSPHELKSPAAVLDVLPAAPTAHVH